jgi:molybdate transport system substrate-binding protein
MRRSSPLVGRLVLPLVALVAVVAAACGDSTPTGTTPSPTTAATVPAGTNTKVTGDITVFAAASLTESFKDVGAAFEAANPGTKVTFNFGASSTLAAQINQGAPADVFASADTANMQKLTDAGGNSGAPTTFATNKLQIIVGKGNPKNVATVTDLAKPGVIVVTCAPEVPIGKYSADVFTKANVKVTPKSYEADVKAVVNKVTLGEADAGIVYATDVQAAGDKAQGVVIPDELNVVATYPIAATKATKNAPAAAAFVAFVAGSAGQTTLAKYGFTKP